MELIYQVIENLVRMFDFKNNFLDEEYPWLGILEATNFALHIAYQDMVQAMSVHMFFGKYMILNTPSVSDWGDIRRLKQ